MKEKCPGFTLVEVMIVLLILGIVLAVAVPLMNSTLDGMELEGATSEVVSAIQYVQSLAIKEGVVYGVEFFPSENRFRCYKLATDETIYNPLDKKLYIVDFTAEGPLNGVDIVSADFGGMPEIVFNSLGEPSSGGTIFLGYAGFQKTIMVSTPIGKVTVN